MQFSRIILTYTRLGCVHTDPYLHRIYFNNSLPILVSDKFQTYFEQQSAVFPDLLLVHLLESLNEPLHVQITTHKSDCIYFQLNCVDKQLHIFLKGWDLEHINSGDLIDKVGLLTIGLICLSFLKRAIICSKILMSQWKVISVPLDFCLQD